MEAKRTERSGRIRSRAAGACMALLIQRAMDRQLEREQLTVGWGG